MTMDNEIEVCLDSAASTGMIDAGSELGRYISSMIAVCFEGEV